MQCIKHGMFSASLALGLLSYLADTLVTAWQVSQAVVAVSLALTDWVCGMLQIKVRQMGLNQTHKANLQDARREAAQAKQAEHTADAKATALEKVSCHHCCIAVYYCMVTTAARPQQQMVR